MKRSLRYLPVFTFLLLMLLVGAVHAYEAQWDKKYFNPRPGEGDLVVPIPGGGAMVFRPILVQGKVTSPRLFTLGTENQKPHPFEFPRNCSLGGSFHADQNGGVYYIAKYEVTESQYEAVMGKKPPATLSALPRANVSWFEAVQFCDELTRWLFQNHKDALPVDDDQPGYIRLPTEIEWEFACRGGEKVPANDFARDSFIPDGRIRDYVQLFKAGDVTRPQAVGLKEPNPLGLHDILGNVSEMCLDAYRLNYHYGRPGGFVVKGGSLRTNESEVRSSLREDSPFYNKEKQDAQRDAQMGFRPVLAAVLITSPRKKETIKSEWKEEANPVDPGVRLSFEEARKKVDGLYEQVSDPGVKHELSAIKSSYDGIAKQIHDIEQMDADSFFRIGAHLAHTVRLQLKRKALMEDFLQDLTRETVPDHQAIEKTRANLAQIEKAVDENLNSYGYSVENLNKKGTNAPDLVKSAYHRVMEKLKQEGAGDQLRTTECMYSHIQKFRQRNAESWKTDLANLK